MKDTLETTLIEIYGHLCGFLEAKIVILGLIDFLFDLPINLGVSDEQNRPTATLARDFQNSTTKLQTHTLKL